MALAGSLVGLVILRECLLNCRATPLSHDPDAVDRVHKGFRVSLQDVAGILALPSRLIE